MNKWGALRLVMGGHKRRKEGGHGNRNGNPRTLAPTSSSTYAEGTA